MNSWPGSKGLFEQERRQWALAMSSLEHSALALWHVLVLLPLGATLALLMHAIAPTQGSGEQKGPLVWPISRLSTWTWEETTAVAIMTQMLAACVHLEQVPFIPPMERIIPRLSHAILGVRHQGWQIQCEAVTIPGIPTKESGGPSSPDSTSSDSDRPRVKRVQTGEALPHAHDLSSLLQGQVSKGTPFDCPALWLWKTQAAHVKQGEVVAVKADSEHGGLGCGPAGEGERVVLFLAGSGLSENGPLVGPLAWTITRQSGLRTLVVKTRKMQADPPSNHFSAPLQDALAGYVYLVDRLGFSPRNVTLLGQGTGASLCVSLTLYLCALSQSERGVAKMARPGKMLLFSPWCDFTVSADILRQYSQADVLDLEAQLRARRRYVEAFDKQVGEDKRQGLISNLCSRYSDGGEVDLALLASELAETVDSLGSSHPLVSPGMPLSCNEYTRMAMQLLGTQSAPPLRVLIFAGGAESHVTEARSLANNLCSVEGVQMDYVEGEDKVSSFAFVTATQVNTRMHEISQAFLST